MPSDGPDRVGRSLAQWRTQRPELDLEAIGLTLRLVLLGKHVEQRASATFAPFGVQPWEFDVLAALRRQGRPHALTAGALAQQVMLTCSGMTHRLDRLEGRGLVERVTDPGDRRRVLVRLTGEGRRVTDRALERRAADARALVAGLSAAERRQLGRLLGRLLEALETEAGGNPE